MRVMFEMENDNHTRMEATEWESFLFLEIRGDNCMSLSVPEAEELRDHLDAWIRTKKGVMA